MLSRITVPPKTTVPWFLFVLEFIADSLYCMNLVQISFISSSACCWLRLLPSLPMQLSANILYMYKVTQLNAISRKRDTGPGEGGGGGASSHPSLHQWNDSVFNPGGWCPPLQALFHSSCSLYTILLLCLYWSKILTLLALCYSLLLPLSDLIIANSSLYSPFQGPETCDTAP